MWHLANTPPEGHTKQTWTGLFDYPLEPYLHKHRIYLQKKSRLDWFLLVSISNTHMTYHSSVTSSWFVSDQVCRVIGQTAAPGGGRERTLVTKLPINLSFWAEHASFNLCSTLLHFTDKAEENVAQADVTHTDSSWSWRRPHTGDQVRLEKKTKHSRSLKGASFDSVFYRLLLKDCMTVLICLLDFGLSCKLITQ